MIDGKSELSMKKILKENKKGEKIIKSDASFCGFVCLITTRLMFGKVSNCFYYWEM